MRFNEKKLSFKCNTDDGSLLLNICISTKSELIIALISPRTNVHKFRQTCYICLMTRRCPDIIIALKIVSKNSFLTFYLFVVSIHMTLFPFGSWNNIMNACPTLIVLRSKTLYIFCKMVISSCNFS